MLEKIQENLSGYWGWLVSVIMLIMNIGSWSKIAKLKKANASKSKYLRAYKERYGKIKLPKKGQKVTRKRSRTKTRYVNVGGNYQRPAPIQRVPRNVWNSMTPGQRAGASNGMY